MALTPKQEKFCIEYIRTGNKTEAYKNAYNTSKMKNKSVNEVACQMFNDINITSRIEELRKELLERNKITLDEVVQHISEIATFDIAECYDENNNLKSIHDIPKHIRSSIMGLKVLEEFQGFGKDRESIGFTKDVKIINKLDAFEKLMKHLGGYEKDNSQKNKKEEKDYSKLSDDEIIKLMALEKKAGGLND